MSNKEVLTFDIAKVVSDTRGFSMEERREFTAAIRRFVESWTPPVKRDIHVWVDGWCRGNGKPDATAGWSLRALDPESNDTIYRDAGVVPSSGSQTNNVAEYCAMIAGLFWVRQEQARNPGSKVTIFTDSKLVIGQLTLGWRVKAAHILPLWAEAAQLLDEVDVKIVWQHNRFVKEVLGH
jgi:ribonuclease HI